MGYFANSSSSAFSSRSSNSLCNFQASLCLRRPSARRTDAAELIESSSLPSDECSDGGVGMLFLFGFGADGVSVRVSSRSEFGVPGKGVW